MFGDTLEVTILDVLRGADHELTLKVFDSGGLMDSDAVTLEAELNTPPTIELLTPEDGTVFGDTSHLEVTLQVSDDTDDLSEIELEWYGLIDDAPCGACEWPTSPLSDGSRSFYLDLSSCTDQNRTIDYILGLTARDPEGQTHTVEHLIGLSCEP